MWKGCWCEKALKYAEFLLNKSVGPQKKITGYEAGREIINFLVPTKKNDLFILVCILNLLSSSFWGTWTESLNRFEAN
jgi:hypothetical protein